MDLSKLDLMINDSLLVIYNSEYGMVYSDSFIDENGIKLSRRNGDVLGRLMEDRNLVKKNGQTYTLTSKGIDIIESGGYLKVRANEKGNIESTQINNTLNLNGDNYGNVNQGSRFENSPSKIKQELNPTKNQNVEKSGKFIMFLDYISNNKLISGIILIVLSAIGVYYGWIKK